MRYLLNSTDGIELDSYDIVNNGNRLPMENLCDGDIIFDCSTNKFHVWGQSLKGKNAWVCQYLQPLLSSDKEINTELMKYRTDMIPFMVKFCHVKQVCKIKGDSYNNFIADIADADFSDIIGGKYVDEKGVDIIHPKLGRISNKSSNKSIFQMRLGKLATLTYAKSQSINGASVEQITPSDIVIFFQTTIPLAIGFTRWENLQNYFVVRGKSDATQIKNFPLEKISFIISPSENLCIEDFHIENAIESPETLSHSQWKQMKVVKIT